MKVFTRVCIKDWSITDDHENFFKVSRGKIYTTSDDKGGFCTVFSTFWVSVPVDVFAGKQKS